MGYHVADSDLPKGVMAEKDSQVPHKNMKKKGKKSKYEHENDTEDIPEEPEPLDVYNRPNWFV